MAGITNGAFCRELSTYGFDMVTLGGYNVDAPTIEAGKQILARGRPEFEITENELIFHLKKEAEYIKDQSNWNGLVSVNLRSTSPEPIIEISKIDCVDVVEINAHCRQPEITELGCGQSLLENPAFLGEFTHEIVEKSKSKVSVKIRANIPGVDYLQVTEAVEDAGADIFHVDAMKPGFNYADYDILKSIRVKTSMFIIGNNSIRDIKSAREMMATGVDGISIARAAIKGKIDFDLYQI